MRKIIIYAIILVNVLTVRAQQDAMQSLHAIAPSINNPAYAGSRDCLFGALTYRNQWFKNIEGAPKMFFVNVNTPIAGTNNNVGLNIVSDKLGVENKLGFALDYAYKLKLNKKHTLQLGVKTTLLNYRTNFNSLRLKDTGDEVFLNNINVFLPNVGVGIYYFSKSYFAGISVPHIFKSEIRKFEVGGANAFSYWYQHKFLTAGAKLNIDDKVVFRPSIIWKFSKTKSQFEINPHFFYDNTLNFGLNYRQSESLDLLVGYRFSNGLQVNAAFDIVTNSIARNTKNSLELMLAYEWFVVKQKIKNPRYF